MKPRKPRYEVKSAAGTGLGFFTLIPILEDKKIIEYTGEILTGEEADKIDGRYLMALDGDYFIDGSPDTNAARYINHCCQPNAKAYRSGARVWIWSIRPIETGEEITIDYGKNYFNDFIKPIGCNCTKCIKNSETNK